MRPSDTEHDPVVRDLRERKIAHGWEFVDPGREERLLDVLAHENPGPLSDEGVRQLFIDLLALTKREVAGN